MRTIIAIPASSTLVEFTSSTVVKQLPKTLTENDVSYEARENKI